MTNESVRDIRQADDHWSEFAELWTGLLSYRYLNKTTPALDAGFDPDENETMPLRHDMRTAHGGIMAAPLCIACPEPAWNDDDVVPAPVIASTQILDDARGVTRVEVLREVVNFGQTMGFMRSKIVDADDHDRVIAVSAGMGVSLGPAPDGYEMVENPPIDVVDSPDMARLHEVFGCTRGDDGHWRLPALQPDQASPHAALHLGPIHILFDIAAHSLAEAHVAETHVADTHVTKTHEVASGVQVINWYVMFVKPGLVGPFRCETQLQAGASGRINVDLTLYDEGRSDRLITTGSAVFEVV